MSSLDEHEPKTPSSSRTTRSTTLSFYVVLALTALAPTLGGCTKLWAAASLAAATGLLFLIAPPKRSLGIVPNIAFASLVALAFVAFLPSQWFPLPDWRSTLEKLGAKLPATVSAQPWLTLQSTLQFFLSLSWGYYLLAADWSLAARKKAWNFIALLVVGLSAGITLANFLQVRIPFWPHTPEFGFFPNRNHSSNVLGIGGILVYALALARFARRQRHRCRWIATRSISLRRRRSLASVSLTSVTFSRLRKPIPSVRMWPRIRRVTGSGRR